MPDRKSRRYARALLTVAEQHRALEGVNGSLQILSDLYQRDPSFRLLFFTRKIETSRKLDLLSSVLGEQVHAVALEFLGILDEKREYDLLKTTAAAYEELYRKRTNRVLVTAVTSVSLEEKEYEEIRRRLESSLNKGIDMKTKVDSRLIGGIKLRIGNTFLDGSVSNRLERLRDSLV